MVCRSGKEFDHVTRIHCSVNRADDLGHLIGPRLVEWPGHVDYLMGDRRAVIVVVEMLEISFRKIFAKYGRGLIASRVATG
jgi:hypothetical protein